MSNTMDKIHGGLLRKFHTLCSHLGITNEQKQTIVESYGVDSSADIDTHDLVDICAKLSSQLNGDKGYKMDKLRKQVMASIGGYLRKAMQESSSMIIKGIACQATGYSDFNKIPAERLRNLYNAFLNKQKDIEAVDTLAVNIYVDTLTSKSNNAMLS